MKSFTRARWIAVGLVLGAAVALFAQEPAIFQRGLTIIRGELLMSGVAGNTIALEGATGNDFETRFIATDPTADRTITLQDASGILLTNVEVSEVVTAANVLAASECGSTFYLSALAGFLTTLPAPSAGCVFRFVVKTAPTSNGYTIGTPTADIGFGMVVERAGGAGVACSAEDLLTLVANQSIPGDWLELRSDATNWYLHGMVDVAAGFTCTVT
jgi:hypothetical protein